MLLTGLSGEQQDHMVVLRSADTALLLTSEAIMQITTPILVTRAKGDFFLHT